MISIGPSLDLKSRRRGPQRGEIQVGVDAEATGDCADEAVCVGEVDDETPTFDLEAGAGLDAHGLADAGRAGNAKARRETLQLET
jgi:hypothetical protein